MRRSFAQVLLTICSFAVVTGCTSEPVGPTRERMSPSTSNRTITLYLDGTTFACAATPGLTCIGFVGKGDVQIPFGLNNQTSQADIQSLGAGAYVFFTEQTSTYEAVCEWVTGEGTRGEKTHTIEIPSHTAVTSAIASDARKTGQFTGFNLFGLGETTTQGEVPVVGGVCPGAGTDGTWISVTLVSSTLPQLFVTRTVSGETIQLPY
jgi:hypothetical protein